MNYISEQSKVIYKSKNGNDTKEFDAIDFIVVRYLGYYNNVCRGRREKEGACESDFVI